MAEEVRKTDIMNEVANKFPEISREKVFKICNVFHEMIIDQVAEGHTVNLRGFGKFYTTETKSHPGMNMQTGSKMIVPNRITVKFQPSSNFKLKVNNA